MWGLSLLHMYFDIVSTVKVRINLCLVISFSFPTLPPPPLLSFNFSINVAAVYSHSCRYCSFLSHVAYNAPFSAWVAHNEYMYMG